MGIVRNSNQVAPRVQALHFRCCCTKLRMKRTCTHVGSESIETAEPDNPACHYPSLHTVSENSLLYQRDPYPTDAVLSRERSNSVFSIELVAGRQHNTQRFRESCDVPGFLREIMVLRQNHLLLPLKVPERRRDFSCCCVRCVEGTEGRGARATRGVGVYAGVSIVWSPNQVVLPSSSSPFF